MGQGGHAKAQVEPGPSESSAEAALSTAALVAAALSTCGDALLAGLLHLVHNCTVYQRSLEDTILLAGTDGGEVTMQTLVSALCRAPHLPHTSLSHCLHAVANLLLASRGPLLAERVLYGKGLLPLLSAVGRLDAPHVVVPALASLALFVLRFGSPGAEAVFRTGPLNTVSGPSRNLCVCQSVSLYVSGLVNGLVWCFRIGQCP